MNLFRIKLISLLAYSAIASLAILGISSCKKQTDKDSSTEEIAEYVEAYSAGVIKVTSSIQVIFNENAAPEWNGKRILKFSPALKGHETWDSTARKLEFVPEPGQLKAGNNYICTVRQSRLIPGAKDIVFSFKVAERYAEMEVTEVRISADDPETAIVSGKITLSEPVENGIVVPSLFKTSTTWKTNTTVDRYDDWTFEFEMSGLRRSKAGSAAVKVYFDAPAIGFGKRVEVSPVIPGRSEFKVIQANLIDAAEPYISIQFSEPLNDAQSLDGLVYLDEHETLRLEREGPQVKLFFHDSSAPTMTLRVDRRIKSNENTPLGTEYKKTFRSVFHPPFNCSSATGSCPTETISNCPSKQ